MAWGQQQRPWENHSNTDKAPSGKEAVATLATH